MSSYSDYLIEGARKLRDVEFGFSVKKGKWDATDWEESGERFKGAKVLQLKAGRPAALAVQKIMNHPELWSFDCSQFVQVVNFYAHMKSIGPLAFNREIAAHGNRLEIKPFRGAHFTMRNHYYRREKQTEWMKYRADTNMPYTPTRIGAWDLVRAAPIGTRVNFRVGAGGAFNYENVVKVNMHPLKFAAQGLGKKIWNHKELLIRLGQERDSSVSTFDEAKKIIWIKEVAIFADLPVPPHNAR